MERVVKHNNSDPQTSGVGRRASYLTQGLGLGLGLPDPVKNLEATETAAKTSYDQHEVRLPAQQELTLIQHIPESQLLLPEL